MIVGSLAVVTRAVAIVGAGPTGTSFLERLLASVDELLGGDDLLVHVVDPHPPGGGRVWRSKQSALLRMNSMAEDVTMFTDDSVACEGPIRPGPSLDVWIERFGGHSQDREVAAEARASDSRSFPTRRLQSAYLGWVFDGVVDAAAPNVRVEVHADAVVDLDEDAGGRQVLTLADGSILEADAVVLAVGHVDVAPDASERDLAEFAARHHLTFVAPGYTADLDDELDAIEPGAPVLLRGTGLGFVDAVAMLTEGRGGRFLPEEGGRLRYLASGDEPLLITGSRRGVPYRSKIAYRLQGPRPALPRFLTPDAVDAVLAAHRPADFRRDLWPLVLKELGYAHYHELFHAHPEAVVGSWEAFDEAWAATAPGDPAVDALVRRAVPNPADRFDLDELDAPLAGVRVAALDDLQALIRRRIAADLDRKADTRHSADVAVFDAMLITYAQIMRAAATGALHPASRIADVTGWWHGLFSTYASGPPAFRLEELLALSRAGIVRFLGAGLEVRTDERRGRFVARGEHVDTEVEVEALIEARLPTLDLRRATDPLLRALMERGAITEHVLVGDDGAVHPTGKVAVAGEALRLVQADAGRHPRRSAIGVHTSRPAAGAFARPRTNALAFRQHDAVARATLRTLAALPVEEPVRA